MYRRGDLQKHGAKGAMLAVDQAQTQLPFHPRDRVRHGGQSDPGFGRRQKHSMPAEAQRCLPQQQQQQRPQSQGINGGRVNSCGAIAVATVPKTSLLPAAQRLPFRTTVTHVSGPSDGASARVAGTIVAQCTVQPMKGPGTIAASALTTGARIASLTCCSSSKATEPPLKAMSNLAMFFESQRNLQRGPDADIDVVLGELAESVLYWSHQESQRHLPVVPRLCAKLRSCEREPILQWLIQACDIMGFHEGVLYSTVLILDRYCALTCDPVHVRDVQTVLMAVICTVIKTCAVQDEILESMSLRDLLVHLCRKQVPFNDILVMEHQVLQTLRFQISAPTPLDFLDALSAPLPKVVYHKGSKPLAPRRVADFLMRLSFFDANLHYGRPHIFLAAAALSVAVCSLQPPNADVGVAAKLLLPLMEDVARACPEFPDVASCINACAKDLHSIWTDFAASPSASNSGLLKLFGDSNEHLTTLLCPPSASALEAMLVSRVEWSNQWSLGGA